MRVKTNMIFKEFEEFQGWSYLDPRPIIIHSDYHDEYLVMWNGFLTTYSAINAYIVMMVTDMYISDLQKECIFDDVKRLIFKDIFPQFLDSNNFNNYFAYWSYVCKMCGPTLEKLKKSHDTQQILRSLDVSQCNPFDICEKIG